MHKYIYMRLFLSSPKPEEPGAPHQPHDAAGFLASRALVLPLPVGSPILRPLARMRTATDSLSALRFPVKPLTLSVIPDRLAVCRLDPAEPVPAPPPGAGFFSVTRTSRELSIVLPEVDLPPGCLSETGWRGLEVHGPLDLSLTGVLSSVSLPLACADISIFAVSTFDTDYILVREKDLLKARKVLAEHGHTVC